MTISELSNTPGAPQPNELPAADRADGGPGLPRQVLEARARLGPDVTPEQVTEDLRGRGSAGITIEEIRAVWDEGHVPAG